MAAIQNPLRARSTTPPTHTRCRPLYNYGTYFSGEHEPIHTATTTTITISPMISFTISPSYQRNKQPSHPCPLLSSSQGRERSNPSAVNSQYYVAKTLQCGSMTVAIVDQSTDTSSFAVMRLLLAQTPIKGFGLVGTNPRSGRKPNGQFVLDQPRRNPPTELVPFTHQWGRDYKRPAWHPNAGVGWSTKHGEQHMGHDRRQGENCVREGDSTAQRPRTETCPC